ncbi:hypothetical protein BJ508DRAFT_418355, partial [Ascobolus immersus RN42]
MYLHGASGVLPGEYLTVWIINAANADSALNPAYAMPVEPTHGVSSFRSDEPNSSTFIQQPPSPPPSPLPRPKGPHNPTPIPSHHHL